MGVSGPGSVVALDVLAGLGEPVIEDGFLNVASLVITDAILRLDDVEIQVAKRRTLLSRDGDKFTDEVATFVEEFCVRE